MEIDFKQLRQLIAAKDIGNLKTFLETNNLEIRDGKIFPKNEKEVKEAIKYWDSLQQARKINLNALNVGA